MTPSAIEILIHCYVSPAEHPRAHAPGVIEELQRLERNGLIQQDGPRIYRATEKGRAHIIQLCSLPFPIPTWVNAHGELIK